MSWAHPSESAQEMQGMKMNGKLIRTQMKPTRCQDFFWPYFLWWIILIIIKSELSFLTCREWRSLVCPTIPPPPWCWSRPPAGQSTRSDQNNYCRSPAPEMCTVSYLKEILINKFYTTKTILFRLWLFSFSQASSIMKSYYYCFITWWKYNKRYVNHIEAQRSLRTCPRP